MFKYKKNKMIVILSTTLVMLLIALVCCNKQEVSLNNSTRTVTSKSLTLTNMKNNYGIFVEEIDVEKTETIIEDEIDKSNEDETVVTEPIVYENMTLNELASKLERSMKNELSGYGYLYASYSLEKGVDPYLALAISLEETGCNYNCSSLIKSCNNVGGMKGAGCGAYGYFNTLDEGIMAFIDNISRNYVAYGLTTADLMNPKYAENPAWSTNVNNYINYIRNN